MILIVSIYNQSLVGAYHRRTASKEFQKTTKIACNVQLHASALGACRPELVISHGRNILYIDRAGVVNIG